MRIRQLLLAPTGMRCHASLTVRSGCERLPTAVSLPVVATYSVVVAACATPDVSATPDASDTISATQQVTANFSTHSLCHYLATDGQKARSVPANSVEDCAERGRSDQLGVLVQCATDVLRLGTHVDRTALGEFGFIDLEVETQLGDIDVDDVALLHQTDRSTLDALRADMTDA